MQQVSPAAPVYTEEINGKVDIPKAVEEKKKSNGINDLPYVLQNQGLYFDPTEKTGVDTFGSGVVQGVDNYFTGVLNLGQQVKEIADSAGTMRQTDELAYNPDNAGKMTDIVADWQQEYGKGSERKLKLEQDLKDRTEKLQQRGQKRLDNYSDVKNADLLFGVGQGVGNMLPSMAVGALTGGVLTPGGAIEQAGNLGTMAFGAGVYGNAVGQALNDGASMDEATMYAMGDTALEVGIEKLFGAIPYLTNGWVDTDRLAKAYAKTAGGQMLIKKIIDITGEGVEEALSAHIEPFLRRLVYDENAKNATPAEILKSAGDGVLVSAVLGIAGIPGDISAYNRRKRDIVGRNITETSTEETGTPLSENSADLTENETVPVEETTVLWDEETVKQTEKIRIMQNLVDNGIAPQSDLEQLTGVIEPDRNFVQQEQRRVENIRTLAEQGIISPDDVTSAEVVAAERIEQNRRVKTDKQRLGEDTILALENYAQSKGLQIEYYSDETDGAKAYTESNRIYVNLAQENPKFSVIIHEIGHNLRNNERRWNALADSINNLISSDYSLMQKKRNILAAYTNTETETGRRALQSISDINGNVDMARLEEEVVLNALEDIVPRLASGENQILELVGQNRTLIDSLLDFLRGIKNNITIALTKSETAMLDEAERNLVNLLRKDTRPPAKTRYSIKTDTNGDTYIEIDDDILKGVPRKQWEETVLKALQSRTVPTNEGDVKINNTSRQKYIHPDNNRYMNNSTKKRKYQMAGNIDEIIQNTGGYAEETARHDTFDHFKRGNINISLNGEMYNADVVIGVTGAGNQVFYHLGNIKKNNNIMRGQNAKPEMAASGTGETGGAINANVITDNNISHQPQDMQVETENNQNITTDNHKKRQFDIIQQANPMLDDYHTGIRSESEILTAKQAFNEDDFTGAPDWSYDDGQNAIKSGRVTVYSSKPISAGVFVSPSKMIAQDYAGGRNARVYSRTVNTDEVAWIDSSEGQFAPVKKNNSRYSLNLDDTSVTNARGEQTRQRAINDFTRNMSEIFGVKGVDKENVKKTVENAALQLEENGYINIETENRLFDELLTAGRELRDTYKEYAPLRKRLRTEGIEPLSGSREYRDFLQKYKGKIKFKRGGLNMDVFYQQLSAEYPEKFPADIVNEYDQMNRLGEVYDEISDGEVSLQEYYGDSYGDFKEESRQRFNEKLGLLVMKLNSVNRYNESLAAHTEKLKFIETAKRQDLTDAEALQKYKEIYAINRKIEKLKKDFTINRDELREVEYLLRLENRDRLNAEINHIRATYPNHGYEILELFKLQMEKRAAMYPLEATQTRQKREAMEDTKNFLGSVKFVSENQNLRGLRYELSTPERIIDRMILDKKKADEFKTKYFRPVHKAVADAQRMKNEYRDKVRRLNIDNNKKYIVEFTNRNNQVFKGELTESGLIQIFGEGLVNEKYLENIGADVQKIKSAVKTMRGIYNDLIDQMNATYIRNGYPPVEKLDNYFPHFENNDDTFLGKLRALTGRGSTEDSIPLSIAGRTDTFKPGRKYNRFAQHRYTDKTAYDMLKGFDMYIETAADVIHTTDSIQRLRLLENAIRYMYSDKAVQEQIDKIDTDTNLTPWEKFVQKQAVFETKKGMPEQSQLTGFVSWLQSYTNSLAGKKSFSDRDWEEKLGRGIYTASKAVQSRVAANMVAGNISSALTNFIPITQMTAEVKPKYILAAMDDTMKNIAVDDGFAARSDFLVNRFGGNRLVQDKVDLTLGKMPVINIAYNAMETVDNFTSNVVTRAMYIQKINEGMQADEAMQYANEFAARLMADRSKGALPTVFNTKNPVAATLSMFQVEQLNQLQYLFKDLPRLAGDAEEPLKELTVAVLKYSIGAFIYNWIYEWVAGRKPAFSPLDAVFTVGKDIKNIAVGEKELGTVIGEWVTGTAEQVPFIGGLMGGGRVPISSALPDGEQLLKLLNRDVSASKKLTIAGQEAIGSMSYLVPPAMGGQGKKTLQGLELMLKNDGVRYATDKNGNKTVKYAVDTENPLNWAQAAAFGRWASGSAREYTENFKGLTKTQTAVFEYARTMGMKNSEAVEFAKIMSKPVKEGGADSDGNGYLKGSEVEEWLNEQGDLENGDKSILYSLMTTTKNNPYGTMTAAQVEQYLDNQNGLSKKEKKYLFGIFRPGSENPYK